MTSQKIGIKENSCYIFGNIFLHYSFFSKSGGVDFLSGNTLFHNSQTCANKTSLSTKGKWFGQFTQINKSDTHLWPNLRISQIFTNYKYRYTNIHAFCQRFKIDRFPCTKKTQENASKRNWWIKKRLVKCTDSSYKCLHIYILTKVLLKTFDIFMYYRDYIRPTIKISMFPLALSCTTETV